MATVEVEVPTIACDGGSCAGTPVDMVPTSASRNGEGDMVCTGSRLPDGWIRCVTVNADGSESPFKVFCPTCAGDL